jgi:DNA-binding response OmpR family regulator
MAFTTLKGKTPETARVDGAIEYVRKMHERITERLEKIEAEGNFELCFKRLTVSRKNLVASLTNTELRILSCFKNRPGSVSENGNGYSGKSLWNIVWVGYGNASILAL